MSFLPNLSQYLQSISPCSGWNNTSKSLFAHSSFTFIKQSLILALLPSLVSKSFMKKSLVGIDSFTSLSISFFALSLFRVALGSFPTYFMQQLMNTVRYTITLSAGPSGAKFLKWIWVLNWLMASSTISPEPTPPLKGNSGMPAFRVAWSLLCLEWYVTRVY